MSDDYVTFPGWTLESVVPTSFIIQNNGKMALTIKRDGTIDVGEGFTPTEAGKAAVEAMRQRFGFILDAEREACAKIADAEISASESCDLEADHNATARNIAAAIRARKGTP